MMTTRFEVISASLELFQGQKAEQAMPFNVGGTILSLIWTPLGSGLTAKKKFKNAKSKIIYSLNNKILIGIITIQ